ADARGQLTVTEVAADSPAAKTGVRPGDLLRQLDGKDLTEETFAEMLRSRAPGDTVKIGLVRKDNPVEATATLTALSRPLPDSRQRALLGVQVGPVKEGQGVAIESIVPGSAAEKAKLKVGEVILKVDQTEIGSSDKLREALAERKPDDV